MKVLMVNNLYAPDFRGGAERSVQLLAEALVVGGTEVTVVCTAPAPQAATELNGVKVVRIGLANAYWPFGDATISSLRRKFWHLFDTYNPVMKARLVEVLRREQPDIVHTNNLQGISVLAWRAASVCGVPVLHTLRDYYLSCARASRFRNGRYCSSTCFACVPFCAARRYPSDVVDAVVGTGQFILDRHTELKFFPPQALRTVIANSAIAVETKRPTGRSLTFGYLGRLAPFKGVELLVRAFANRNDGGWELLIAGTGQPADVDHLQALAAKASRPDQIRFLGWTESAEFLRCVDVLVVPSLWQEPLSRAAIEAQVSGIAVVASRRGGLSEVVEDGVTGKLFDPDEDGDLVRTIESLLAHPEQARRFGDAARTRADRFRPAVVAAQYLRAYEEVLVNRSRAQTSS